MPENVEKEEFGKHNGDLKAIDVAVLMAQVILKTPDGTATVKGIVEALRPWPKIHPTTMYGDLKSLHDKSIMSFQCPFANAPRLKEHIIFRGALKAEKSDWHRGFDFEIFGEKIGEWAPSNTTSLQPITSIKRKSKLSLERFISKDLPKRLVCIGTQTAIGDLRLTLSRNFNQPFDILECTTGLDTLKAIVTENAPKYDGFCLLRGGGDEDSFATWNDNRLIETLVECGKPFYTALGHWNNYTLADKYADESFGNPSDFASAFKEALSARRNLEKLRSDLDVSNRDNQRLKGEFAKTKRDESERRTRLLDDAILRLQQLPATLEKQIGFFIGTAVKTFPESSSIQSTKIAAERSIANLNQAADNARNSIAKLTKVSRFHSWTWLFSIFLLGALVGSFGYHYIAQSKIDSMQEQLRIIQQQISVTSSAPESIPPDGKLTKGHRGR